jgi:ankyrin repeat protein
MSTSIFTNSNNSLNLESLRAKSKLSSLVTDISNDTLLQIAAVHNDVETLKRIDFNHIDGYALGAALAKAVLSNSNDTAEYLLGIPGLDVNNHEFLAIFGAILNKNYELAQKISEHPSFDPNKLLFENSALHCIAWTKSPTKDTILFAQKLIDLKGDLDKKNRFGFTPLYEACSQGNLELAQLFLDNGASLDALSPENISILHGAALSGNATLIQLLLDKGLDCNQATVNNETPLHYAVLGGNKEAAEKLIANVADCNRKSKEGFTPLDLACKYNLPELIPALLANTTLSRKDLMPDSDLVQLLSLCDSNVQHKFLIKALKTYLVDRQNSPDYLNFLNMGIHKVDKLAAAQALLDTLNGKVANLQPHHAALKNGLLSSLYDLYTKNKKISPEPQVFISEPQEEKASYTAILTQFNATNSSSETSTDDLENSPQLPPYLIPIITDSNREDSNSEEDNQSRSQSLPSPLKTTPFLN